MNEALTLAERLTQLRNELDALQQIKTQEDFDEGARLHEKHNAPWRQGQYSHLEFEPYRYREFPRMLYGLDYPAACQARAEANMVPAWGTDEADRTKAMVLADRRVAACTVIVKTEAELRALGPHWCESPTAVVTHLATLQKNIELAAAERAFDDRRMSPKAKREIDAFDEQAEHFVTEIPRTPKPGPRRKVAVADQKRH